MKALGKKPPTMEELEERHGASNCGDAAGEEADHYRQALLEAAEELENYKFLDDELDEATLKIIAKYLRISAGEEG